MTDNFEKDIDVLNKKKIINGVDVSGCKHYKNRTCIADYYLTDIPFGEAKCELNPNCYYKQLKRKEQECEELKEKYLELKEQNGSNIVQLNTVNEQLDQLKAEVINKTDTIEHIFRCLIKANYQGKLNDTIFINKFSTLFDYIAGALGIEETDEYVSNILEGNNDR